MMRFIGEYAGGVPGYLHTGGLGRKPMRCDAIRYDPLGWGHRLHPDLGIAFLFPFHDMDAAAGPGRFSKPSHLARSKPMRPSLFLCSFLFRGLQRELARFCFSPLYFPPEPRECRFGGGTGRPVVPNSISWRGSVSASAVAVACLPRCGAGRCCGDDTEQMGGCFLGFLVSLVFFGFLGGFFFPPFYA